MLKIQTEPANGHILENYYTGKTLYSLPILLSIKTKES